MSIAPKCICSSSPYCDGREGCKKLNFITKLPKHEGLLQRLEEKDKKLAEFKDLQDPFRQGFYLAEQIVRQWAKENYGI